MYAYGREGRSLFPAILAGEHSSKCLGESSTGITAAKSKKKIEQIEHEISKV